MAQPTGSYINQRKQASFRRRLAVLGAAGRTFAKYGYQKTTVEEIAREAGVSKGLVFHFFGSKQDLFSSLLEDSLNQWSTLSEYRASGAEKSSLEELRGLFLASFEFVEKNPVLLLFTRDEEDLLDTYRREFSRRNKRWRKRIRETLKEGVRRSEIEDVDISRVSVIFHEVQTAMLSTVVLEGSAPRYDSRKIDLTIDIFLRGIKKQAVDTPK